MLPNDFDYLVGMWLPLPYKWEQPDDVSITVEEGKPGNVSLNWERCGRSYYFIPPENITKDGRILEKCPMNFLPQGMPVCERVRGYFKVQCDTGDPYLDRDYRYKGVPRLAPSEKDQKFITDASHEDRKISRQIVGYDPRIKTVNVNAKMIRNYPVHTPDDYEVACLLQQLQTIQSVNADTIIQLYQIDRGIIGRIQNFIGATDEPNNINTFAITVNVRDLTIYNMDNIISGLKSSILKPVQDICTYICFVDGEAVLRFTTVFISKENKFIFVDAPDPSRPEYFNETEATTFPNIHKAFGNIQKNIFGILLPDYTILYSDVIIYGLTDEGFEDDDPVIGQLLLPFVTKVLLLNKKLNLRDSLLKNYASVYSKFGRHGKYTALFHAEYLNEVYTKMSVIKGAPERDIQKFALLLGLNKKFAGMSDKGIDNYLIKIPYDLASQVPKSILKTIISTYINEFHKVASEEPKKWYQDYKKIGAVVVGVAVSAALGYYAYNYYNATDTLTIEQFNNTVGADTVNIDGLMFTQEDLNNLEATPLFDLKTGKLYGLRKGTQIYTPHHFSKIYYPESTEYRNRINIGYYDNKQEACSRSQGGIKLDMPGAPGTNYHFVGVDDKPALHGAVSNNIKVGGNTQTIIQTANVGVQQNVAVSGLQNNNVRQEPTIEQILEAAPFKEVTEYGKNGMPLEVRDEVTGEWAKYYPSIKAWLLPSEMGSLGGRHGSYVKGWEPNFQKSSVQEPTAMGNPYIGEGKLAPRNIITEVVQKININDVLKDDRHDDHYKAVELLKWDTTKDTEIVYDNGERIDADDLKRIICNLQGNCDRRFQKSELKCDDDKCEMIVDKIKEDQENAKSWWQKIFGK